MPVPIRRAFVDENLCQFECTVVSTTHSIVQTKTALNNSSPTSRIDILGSCRSHPFSFKKQYMLDLFAYGNFADKLLSILSKGDRILIRTEYKPLTISDKKSKSTVSNTTLPDRFPLFEIKKIWFIQTKSPLVNFTLSPESSDLSSSFPDLFPPTSPSDT